jgi:hypothetical protein|tara:strand:+ start:1877 stop:2152 length:276 start_codon:yes stop_codon:yes gene_type:complete
MLGLARQLIRSLLKCSSVTTKQFHFTRDLIFSRRRSVAIAAAITSQTCAEPIEIANAGFEGREASEPFAEGSDKYPQWLKKSYRHFEISDN